MFSIVGEWKQHLLRLRLLNENMLLVGRCVWHLVRGVFLTHAFFDHFVQHSLSCHFGACCQISTEVLCGWLWTLLHSHLNNKAIFVVESISISRNFQTFALRIMWASKHLVAPGPLWTIMSVMNNVFVGKLSFLQIFLHYVRLLRNCYESIFKDPKPKPNMC